MSETFERNAKGVREMLSMKFDTLDFEGVWHDAFGTPERRGVWFVWGNSGNGKTSFVMQLCKYLCRFGRVAYNSMEEGACLTMQDTLRRFGMMEVNRRFLLIDNESIEQLSLRLKRQYIEFKERHRNKLMIFISHASGRLPTGRSGKSVMFDASLKIYVEGYRAFSKGRFIGPKGYYDIWPEEAARYWGECNMQ